MEINACLVCGGRGRMRCGLCGGSGQFGPDVTKGPPPRKRLPGEDPLAGRWNGPQGGWYEIVKQGADRYDVTEHGLRGQVGSGTAMLSEHDVTMEITNNFLGRYTIQLRLEGDTLRGTLNVLGNPMPMVFARA